MPEDTRLPPGLVSTSERCSSRTSDTHPQVVHLEKGRCSLGLYPLRGMPARPLGLRPSPLALRLGERRSGHYRVSIRSGLEMPPPKRSVSTPLGFFTSCIRSSPEERPPCPSNQLQARAETCACAPARRMPSVPNRGLPSTLRICFYGAASSGSTPFWGAPDVFSNSLFLLPESDDCGQLEGLLWTTSAAIVDNPSSIAVTTHRGPTQCLEIQGQPRQPPLLSRPRWSSTARCETA